MLLVRHGPWVPARIERIDGVWLATINDAVCRPGHTDPHKAACVLDIWHSAEFIDEAEYEYLIAVKRWAEKEDRNYPAANPRKVINLNILPPVFRSRR